MSDHAVPGEGLRFRLGRIPVSMPWSAWVGILVIAYLWFGSFERVTETGTEAIVMAGVFAVLFYVSILGHELAHAWVARASGNPVEGITLWGFGGYTSYQRRNVTPLREGLIAAAGPAMTIVIGLLLRAVAENAATLDLRVGVLLYALGISNIYLGIFNALPGLPLDGGAVLRSVVWALTGDQHRGTIIAAWAGRVVAVGAFLWFVVPAFAAGGSPDLSVIVFGAIISAWMFAGASQALKGARVMSRVPGISAASLARRAVVVTPDTPLSEALRRAQDVGATSIVAVDAEGRPMGMSRPEAVAAVPEERRPWVPVSSVSAAIPAGTVISADLQGAALLGALQAAPAAQYLVVPPDGSWVGILTSADVEAALTRR
jgi:Zn-dependent protease/CBS domain-containing protein